MSLAASLLSAFLAMLGKQWLNQYASIDMRGTAIERSQNRQHKLDGIITWYFNHVMETLPLMLQAALLLLGCALSRYLWDINITVAYVVIVVTLFGIVLYIFIIIAGTVSKSCPYQTPGSHALRYLWPRAKNLWLQVKSYLWLQFLSLWPHAKRTLVESRTHATIGSNLYIYSPWWSRDKIMPFLKDMVLEVPCAITIDAYHLGKVMVWSPSVGVYHLASPFFISLVSHFHNTSATSEQEPDLQLTVLDLRCILWMLQTSLDKDVHLSTLKHLATMVPLASFDPALVVDCFNAFIGCINVSKNKAAIVEGLEQLATVSAVCFLHTSHQLSAMDPTSSVFEDVHQHHKEVFPVGTDFRGLLWYSTMAKAYGLADQHFNPHHTQWDNFGLSAQQHIPIAQALAEAAQVEYQRAQHHKVPRRILRFALCSLSMYPPPPTSIIADCLSIIAIDLGCDILSIRTTLADRCVCI